MRKRSKLFLSLFLLLYLAIAFATSLWISFLRSTPEENIRLFYLKEISLKNNFYFRYNAEDNEKYSTDLIKPRNTVLSPKSNEVVPSDFFGIYIFSLIPYLFLQENKFWLFIFPLFSVLGIYSVYRFCSILFNEKVGLLSAILVGLFPPYFYWSGRLMTDIPSLALLLFGFSFYLQHLKSKKTDSKLAILTSIFISSGLLLRYTNIILVFLFFVFFLDYKNLFKKNVFIYHIMIFSVSLFILSPILILNTKLYGNPLITGQAIYSGSSSAIRTKDINLLSHFSKFFIYFFGFITTLGMLNVIQTLTRKVKDSLQVRLTLFTVSLLFVYVLVFGRSDVFGQLLKDVLLYFSQVRYYLGIYIFLLINSIVLLSSISKRSITIILLMSVFFLMSILNLKQSGVIPYFKEVKADKELQNLILSNTESDSYIFLRIYDRLIFPERKVVSYYNSGLDLISNRVENTVKLAKALKDDNKKVYFLKEDVDPVLAEERNYEPFSMYSSAFNEYSLELRLSKEPLYEVQKK